METIVCATRGGAGSRAVQMRAIQYAAERSAPLVFLFVIDMSNLDRADENLQDAMREELTWLGRTLLLIARGRADNSQVASEIVIREGIVREEIVRFINERSAELLLMGAPRGTTDTLFGDDVIEQYAKSIQEETGVLVEVVRPESPISEP